MAIDIEKQVYGSWLNVDVEIHCFCGQYIQVVDEESKHYICKKCGQEWAFQIVAIPVEELPKPESV